MPNPNPARDANGMPLYAIPAGRLTPRDIVYVNGEPYGTVDRLRIVKLAPEPCADTVVVVEIVFVRGDDSVVPTLARFAYEMVTTRLSDNLTAHVEPSATSAAGPFRSAITSTLAPTLTREKD